MQHRPSGRQPTAMGHMGRKNETAMMQKPARNGTAMCHFSGTMGASSSGSGMSGMDSRFNSSLGGYIDYSLGPDHVQLKIQVSQLIAKKLRLQKRVYDTQLKNTKVLAL